MDSLIGVMALVGSEVSSSVEDSALTRFATFFARLGFFGLALPSGLPVLRI